jgi:hypothetical protein
LAWDLATDEAGDKAEDFNRVVVHLAIEEEQTDYYGDERLKVILSQWIPAADLQNPQDFMARIITRFKRGVPLMRARLEIKDDDVQLGDFVDVRTAKLSAPDGTTEQRIMQVVKKKHRDDGTIEIQALDTALFVRYFFYAPDGLPDYDAADEDDRRYGYLSDDDGTVGTDHDSGYHAW